MFWKTQKAAVQEAPATKPADWLDRYKEVIRQTGNFKHSSESFWLKKYRRSLQELEACFREVIFPDLQPRHGRVDLIEAMRGTQPSEALYVVYHLQEALKVAGDVCEFGIAQGATSTLIANEIRDTDKTLWLFDSFQGLPAPTEKDVLIDDIFGLGDMKRYQGTMASPLNEVKARLDAIEFDVSRVQIVPGFIEQTSQIASLPKQVCFAFVDFDFYEPIKIALELLDARLPVGGRVVIDDYGFFSAGAQAAVDEFHAAHASRYRFEKPHVFAGHFAMLIRTA